MTTLENSRTFRDVLTQVMGEPANGLSDDGVRKIEACIPTWRELSTESTTLVITTLFEAAVEEQEIAEKTAHLAAPRWVTRKPDTFGRYEDGTIRRYHDIESTDIPATNAGSNGSVGVTLTGTEYLGQRSVFSVLLIADGGEYLSAEQSRALAAALLNAADKADSLDLAQ